MVGRGGGREGVEVWWWGGWRWGGGEHVVVERVEVWWWGGWRCGGGEGGGVV